MLAAAVALSSTLLILVVFIGLALLLFLVGIFRTHVPFVPVSGRILSTLQGLYTFKEGDTFYDLGAGDGRAVLAIAAAHPTVTAVGVECAPLPYMVSLARAALPKRDNARFLFARAETVPLSEATHVFLYLLPGAVKALLPKLERELPKGARVVSCDFPIVGRTPSGVTYADGMHHRYALYVYDF